MCSVQCQNLIYDRIVVKGEVKHIRKGEGLKGEGKGGRSEHIRKDINIKSNLILYYI